jgi:hypothetical protein
MVYTREHGPNDLCPRNKEIPMLRLTTDEERRAAAGAAWLDTRAPGWESRVIANTLNIDSTRLCVIGQLYGTWDCEQAPTYGVYRDELHRLGFITGGADFNPTLTAAWRVEIANRRSFVQSAA